MHTRITSKFTRLCTVLYECCNFVICITDRTYDLSCPVLTCFVVRHIGCWHEGSQSRARDRLAFRDRPHAGSPLTTSTVLYLLDLLTYSRHFYSYSCVMCSSEYIHEYCSVFVSRRNRWRSPTSASTASRWSPPSAYAACIIYIHMIWHLLHYFGTHLSVAWLISRQVELYLSGIVQGDTSGDYGKLLQAVIGNWKKFTISSHPCYIIYVRECKLR